MQGPGYAPPPPKRPSTGALVVLRVIFVAVPILSIGFLAWVATLRAAIVTRRAAEWWVFAASVVALGTSFAFLSTDHTDDFSTPNGNIGMSILLLNAVACAGYFLYADIRHFSRLGGTYAGRPPMTPGYGYPHPSSPFTAATVPSTPQAPYAPPPMPHTPAPHAPASHTPASHTPVPQPPATAPAPPQRPAPARIDQVRAELDELSDYLRKHPGGSDGDHEGGR
ncbi:hypothetical protein ACIRJO_22105 [Streptomyces sp. NPDC102394]|uniref:hypothetical protein n=1 Tax=Streptomyces sp. NPDC102394 TaxID=3366167 RepID=UPI003828FB89